MNIVIGIIRYSMNSKFNNGKYDVFENSYFENRLKIFKNITLESFKHQTNKNFKLYVLHDVNIPIKKLNKLNFLKKEYPFIENILLKNYDNLNKIILKNLKEGLVATFRIDNDDAVQCNFIETIYKNLKSQNYNKILTFSNIISLKQENKNSYIYEPLKYRFNSIGLTLISNTNNFKNIFQAGQHTKVNINHDFIELENGGLRYIHDTNVTNNFKTNFQEICKLDEIENILNNYKVKVKLNEL